MFRTKPEDFLRDTLDTLNYLDANLPEGSTVFKALEAASFFLNEGILCI